MDCERANPGSYIHLDSSLSTIIDMKLRKEKKSSSIYFSQTIASVMIKNRLRVQIYLLAIKTHEMIC